MATDRKFVVKNGLQAQNIDFVDSTTATPTATLTASLNGSGVLSFDSGTFEIDGANNTLSMGGNLSVTGTVTDDGATHDGDVTFTGTNYNLLWDKSADRLVFDNGGILSWKSPQYIFASITQTGSAFNMSSSSGHMTVSNTHANKYIKLSTVTGGDIIFSPEGTDHLKVSTTGIELTGNITNSASGKIVHFGPAAVVNSSALVNFNLSQGSSTSNMVTYESDYSAGGESHWHSFYSQNDSSNGALARFDFNGHDSAGNDTMYGMQKFMIRSGTDGSECGAYQLSLIKDDNVSGSGTAGLIDAINIDTADVTLSNKGVNNGIYRVFGLDLYLQGNASQGYPNLVFDTGTYDTTFTMTTATAERVITFPDVSGTVVTTGNADVGATTTSSSDADHVLIDDGGVLKKITPANLGIGSGGGGAGSTYALIQIFG
tara:strand:- start:192 stop:1481 length:1290 start_codon:yes stop_codon:yes gene_type:complete